MKRGFLILCAVLFISTSNFGDIRAENDFKNTT